MNPDLMIDKPGDGESNSRTKSRLVTWCRRVHSDLTKDPEAPRIRWFLELILPILIGVILMVWIRLGGIDLKLQQLIYHAGGNSWAMGDVPFWNILYDQGRIPAAFFAILGAIGFILTYFRKALRPWRRIFVFLYLTMVVGPGVIVNSALKDNWGRPRPKEVQGLGGGYQFEPVLKIDPSSPGNSFPSGHAAMAFYFVGGYFIFRRQRRDLARGFLIAGLVFGGAMGLARMLQGGHFLSDVVWAGLICYYTAMGVYYALGLDRNLFEPDRQKSWQIPRRVMGWGIPLLTVLLAAILLGTPYRVKWEAPVENLTFEEGSFDLLLIFSVGEVEIVPSDTFGITKEANGRGVPTSRIKRSFLMNDTRDYPEVVYKEELRGWFSELDTKAKVYVPWDRIRRLRLHPADAGVRIVLGRASGNPSIEVSRGRGPIHVSLSGQPLKIEEEGGPSRVEWVDPNHSTDKDEGLAGYTLKIGRGYKGAIKIEENNSH